VDTLTSNQGVPASRRVRSFVSAADRLDFSPAMVSKHVMRIENGSACVSSTAKQPHAQPDRAGRVYFGAVDHPDDLEETESNGVARHGSARTLRISCPSWFASQRMADMLVSDSAAASRRSSSTSLRDRTVDLVDEGYDLGIRVRGTPPRSGRGLIARPLWPISFVLGGLAANYLKRKGLPKIPTISPSRSVAVAKHRLTGPERS